MNDILKYLQDIVAGKYSDEIIDNKDQEIERGRAKKVKTTWTTREGKKVKVVDMSDSHLKNAMGMILGKVLLRDHYKYIKYIKKLLLPEIWYDMEIEAKRRGLLK